ncbi:acyl-CoA thioesterase [Planococcus salinus]|uniref:Acyl-CoA thioesterase n=1 Tax=Planococcus salinus TaxID=1848460 RepID=A0A3M8P4U5_9BACL|nr:thioesterase family protein [Planococcus salinus]RNF38234.1 acyl-CoA thioesterase [Planococcus salinus]
MNLPETKVYVRFCETDAGGHVSNTSYFFYMEEARSKFFEEINFIGEEKRKNIDFIIASTSCDYIAQAFAGQTLIVTTTIEQIGSKSFKMAHEITEAKTGGRIAKGSAAIVCFDYDKQQSELIPPELRQVLEELLVPA